MIVKLGKNGKFLSCARFPDCTGALTIDGKEIATDKPIGTDPTSGLPLYVKIGRFGPYVQLGEMVKKTKAKKTKKENQQEKEAGKIASKPKMASIPKTKDPSTVTVADALTYLTLPRILGINPETGQKITASIGRFGPYVVCDGDFRSVKKDDIYTITLERALEILREPKKSRGFARKKKV